MTERAEDESPDDDLDETRQASVRWKPTSVAPSAEAQQVHPRHEAAEVDEGDDDEHTVVSRRPVSTPQEPAPVPVDPAPEVAGTEVSAADADEDTEEDEEDDRTRAVARPHAHGSHPGDHTLMLARARAARARPPGLEEDDESTRAIDRRPSLIEERVAGRRRGIAPPPLPPELAAKVAPAIEAVGPGAVARYSARDLPQAPPSAEPAKEEASRQRDVEGLSSVARQGRRHARLSLAAWVVVCVGSVSGPVALALRVF